MAKITINFMGVAVHLVGVIPGVPCRVVMPDATASYLYDGHVLDRHFTSIQWKDEDGVEQKEEKFRWHMTVGDPESKQPFQLDQSMKELYQLTTWVPNLQLSSEVIYAGRAAIYFDIFYGKLSAHMMEHGALFTSLECETEDDDPWLLTVPFHYASVDYVPNPPLPQAWPMPVNNVSFVNMGDGCRSSDYDFALNFLVTRGGMPVGLKDLPGQPIVPPPVKSKKKFKRFNSKVMPLQAMDALSAACSASWFP
jgi:hypothetical protein